MEAEGILFHGERGERTKITLTLLSFLSQKTVLFVSIALWITTSVLFRPSSGRSTSGTSSSSPAEALLRLHEPGKLLEVDSAVPVEVGLLDHGSHFLVRQGLAKVVHGEPELLLGDEAVAVAVKHAEGVGDVLLDFGVAPQHHFDELVEVDGAVAVLVDVADHVLELLLRRLKAMVAHHPTQLANLMKN